MSFDGDWTMGGTFRCDLKHDGIVIAADNDRTAEYFRPGYPFRDALDGKCAWCVFGTRHSRAFHTAAVARAEAIYG